MLAIATRAFLPILTLAPVIRKHTTVRPGENAVPPADGQDPLSGGFLVEDHVGFLLRRAHQRHVALFLEIAGHHGLTPTQFAALFKAVELGHVTQNLLGRLIAMDPATIQGVVRRLTSRGLLCRAHDPMDRRTAVLAPTEEGIALIARTVACAQRAHEAALAPLSAAEQSQLLALLRKLA
jgi:MarR family transcriptional regulator, lower aerobic nicotinate degradation pathway regulator